MNWTAVTWCIGRFSAPLWMASAHYSPGAELNAKSRCASFHNDGQMLLLLLSHLSLSLTLSRCQPLCLYLSLSLCLSMSLSLSVSVSLSLFVCMLVFLSLTFSSPVLSHPRSITLVLSLYLSPLAFLMSSCVTPCVQCLSLSEYLYFSLSSGLSVSVSLLESRSAVSQSPCLTLSSLYLSLCLSFSLCLSICQSVCLSVCQSLCMSVCSYLN